MINVDWDRYAEQYDRITLSGANPAYLELKAILESHFDTKLLPGDLVVDIGGGTGNFSIDLARKNPAVRFVLMDNSTGMLENACRKSKGLDNFEVVEGDLTRDIPSITKKLSRRFNHVILMHALYTTGGMIDEEPRQVLADIAENMELSPRSTLFLADINRPLKTLAWIPYCLLNAYASFRVEGWGRLESMKKTLSFFGENDQSKQVNFFIDMMQKDGRYLLCSLETLSETVKSVGFRIEFSADHYYRGRDNLVVATRL